MRYAIIVEGTQNVCHPRTKLDLFKDLWQVRIPCVFGLPEPAFVLGINKGSIAAMRLRESRLRRTTSIAEPLDVLVERCRQSNGIDSFLVLWDLLPPWDREAGICRWNETLAFYEGLSLSKVLPQLFRDAAKAKLIDLKKRSPAGRHFPPRLCHGGILAICMDPIFESCLMDEKSMRRCLGVDNRRTPHWPADWNPKNRNAERVISDAIDVARAVNPNAKVFRRVRGRYEIQKTEWGLYFIQSGMFNSSLRKCQFGQRLCSIEAGDVGLRTRSF